MKSIIYNGSPRGKKSNTKLLLNQFIKGMYKVREYDVVEYYLASKSQRIAGVEAFKKAEEVIFAFPLYTDSMPGIVKEFIEMLDKYTLREVNPKIGFIIQSGFPEPAHSRYLEHYLEKLVKRFNATYLGTVVKGGVEGIQIMPGWMTRRLYKRFYRLGKYFAETGEFDRTIIHKLAPREHFSKRGLFVFKLMQKTGFSNFYWDNQLKKNGVFEQRFAKPFTVE